ncbi:hypothetical protein [Lysinibacillus xylanilyticus]|uniref:Type 4 fimbrial biogenesis protein PilX N-terminal domain-containing protein n=1 Tax=Lysinibacillus xylanilyticus TaxID=582475 RepID=A0ABT4EJ25_9BACI|nr:hypothetical protein [Lysinibacillus xylanilyticus]MCY9545652.1 hypothetical protein [Lysinibacillus xylanilyticus]
MKKSVVNNNNGYILAIVLIISIIFSVIFLSFIGISSNTTKQNEVVEGTIQSQSIAEMGASYFQHTMINEIITTQPQIINDVIKERENDIKNNQIKNDNHYKESAMKYMQKNLEECIKNLQTNINIQQNNKNSFKIGPTYESKFFSKDGDKLIIAFTSTGYDELKQANIKGKMEVDFANVIGQGTGGGSEGTAIIKGNTIADPGANLNICPNNKKDDLSNMSCQIKDSIDYSQNDKLTFNNSIYRVSGAFSAGNLNNDINNSTIYILGSMRSGNLNSMNQLKLHVKGALTVGHFNGGGLVGSTIEVLGNASMENIKLTKSTMYIDGGNWVTSIGNINGIEDSIIYINYNASIKGADLNRNATICVNGELNIGHINNNSGNTSNIYAKKSNNPKVITNSAAFEKACMIGGSTVTPGAVDYTTNYEYSY